jgi:excisionase family DNA binding protein
MNDMSTQNRILSNEVLTVREVATYLRVTRVTVWRWCQQGVLPASRIGRSWRIRREDMLSLLERCESTGLAQEDQNDFQAASVII